MKFMVLYRKYFPDEESARKTLKKLPAVLVAGAKIQGEWDADTVFFCQSCVLDFW